MEEHMTNTDILQALTGPFSSLVLAVTLLYTIGRWLSKWVPVYIEGTMMRWDKIIDSHDEDRRLYQTSLNELGTQQKQIADDVKVIRDSITR
jgi:hypothetical protein